MRVGHLELLALAGFFGFRGSSKMTPFVGSVKPKLNVVDGQELNVMIPIEPVESVRSVRFLRRYDKLHSKRLWSVESKRYAYKGFRACHPPELRWPSLQRLQIVTRRSDITFSTKFVTHES